MVLLAVSAFFVLLSVYTERNIEREKGHISIRFTKEALGAERLKQIYEKEKEIPQMTLWRQVENAKISYPELKRNVMVKSVEIWGDANAVYPDCLSAGSALQKGDVLGCMLSEKAAYEVFGNTDVLGKKIFYEEKSYTIRGILKIEDPVFLRENEKADFSYIEVSGKAGGGVEKIRGVLSAKGVLLEEGAVIEADIFRGLLRFLRLIPVGVLICLFYRKIKNEYYENRIVLWAVRIGVAILFVVLFWNSWCFSEDFIPSRWSDFEFFGDLLEAQIGNYKRYLDIEDIYRDRELFWAFKRTLIVMGVAVIGALGMWMEEKGKDKSVVIIAQNTYKS